MLNKFVGAAFLCGALGIIGPVVAQEAAGVTETSVTKPDGSIVVTRRETVSAGWVAVPQASPVIRRGSPNRVSGGIGGAIGGRDILGVTPPYNVKLPLSMQ